MRAKITLSELKVRLSKIMIDMGRSSDDVVHAEAIKRLKAQNMDEINSLKDGLIDIALKRLATDVGRKKTKAIDAQQGRDLFGAYRGVPDMMSTGSGKSKNFWKASFNQSKEWLATHSGAPSIDHDRNKGVAFLLEDVTPYVKTGDESLEELVILKAKALGKIDKAD